MSECVCVCVCVCLCVCVCVCVRSRALVISSQKRFYSHCHVQENEVKDGSILSPIFFDIKNNM